MLTRPCHDLVSLQRRSRRQLLCAGGLSLLGLSLPGLLRGRADAAEHRDLSRSGFGQAKSCILLFMWGGPAHQDTWDMKPGAPPEIRGEFKPIATRTSGVEICEHLPQLAQQTERLAIVRSMTHDNVDHTAATHYLLTGQPPLPGKSRETDWPHFGAVLSRLGRGPAELPPFVSMRPKLPGDVPRFVEQSRGQWAGWLGQAHDPLTIDSDPSQSNYHVGDFALPAEVSLARLDDRRRLLTDLDDQFRLADAVQNRSALDVHYRRAFAMLRSAAGGSAFRLDEESLAVRERYGLNPHGQSVLQARRLVERGVPLVTVFWPNDGTKNVSVYWDTHSRNFVDLKDRLMPPADQAFSALLDDLDQRGLLDETLVIWTGEFGRTPRVGQRNSDAGAGADGRDHWPGCFTTVLAGGGIRGGVVHGSSDRHAAYPASHAVRPIDLVATAYHCLGVPTDTMLEDNQGRPLAICPGTPISALI